MLYQYGNEANPRAHYEATGPEILRDLPEIDVFVAGLGTGGTLTGTGRYLKEQKPGVKVIAAAPHPGDLVQGLRSLEDGFIPPVLDLSLLDRKIMVSNHDSFTWTKGMLREEGIFAGVSAGAVAGLDVRRPRLENGNIVILSPTTAGSTCRRASTRSRSRSWRGSTPRCGGKPRLSPFGGAL